MIFFKILGLPLPMTKKPPYKFLKGKNYYILEYNFLTILFQKNFIRAIDVKEEIFYLTFVPPSKANRVKINARAFTKSGKRYIVPKDISTKINKAIWELRLQNEERGIFFDKPVEVYITFILPNRRRRDLDNIMKTLGDCLTYANIIKDDDLIYKQTLEKFHIKGKEGVVIRIKPLNRRKTPNIEKLEEFKRKLNGF